MGTATVPVAGVGVHADASGGRREDAPTRGRAARAPQTADARAALDTAVLAAHGFDPRQDLLALNLDDDAQIERNEPVTGAGVPSGDPPPEKPVKTLPHS